MTAFVPTPNHSPLVGLCRVTRGLCFSLWQAFSKKCVDRRKEWLTSWLEHRRERRMEGLNEVGRFLSQGAV